MSFGFEVDLRNAERTINRLIESAGFNGGKVYLVDQKSGFTIELTGPIGVSYFMPVGGYEDEQSRAPEVSPRYEKRRHNE